MPDQKEIQRAHSAYLNAVRGTEDHAFCRLCDGQGEVIRAKVIKTGQVIFICDECDVLCDHFHDVGSERCEGFEAFARRHGIQPLWTELEIQVPGVR